MDRMYSLFDVKMREYGGIVIARNDEAIVRGLKDSLEKDLQSPVGRHPEDFELHCLGTFDDRTGKIVAFESYQFVVNVGTLRVNVLQVVSDEDALKRREA